MSQEKAAMTEAASIQLISSGSRYGDKPSDCLSYILWIIPGYLLKQKFKKEN